MTDWLARLRIWISTRAGKVSAAIAPVAGYLVYLADPTLILLPFVPDHLRIPLAIAAAFLTFVAPMIAKEKRDAKAD